jgi:hypothetical protein
MPQQHLINNLEAKFGQEVATKVFIELQELQDSILFAQMLLLMSSIQYFKVATSQALECYSIWQNIRVLIYAIWLENLQTHG